jgi:anti-anti-sigma factor
MAAEVGRRGAGVSWLEVSVEAGDLGPVIVLAGDADSSSVTQLNEVLTAQVSGRTRHLTIDATNLRSIDPATAQTLMLAALIVMVQGGSTVLVNPQEPVLKMLNHARTTEMFTIQSRTPARPANEKRRPGPMTDHKHKPDWSVTLRRQPASLSTGHAENDTSMFEIICRECGDDPALDHRAISAELQQIRGPYTLSDGVAAFTRHNEVHDGTGEMQPGRN